VSFARRSSRSTLRAGNLKSLPTNRLARDTVYVVIRKTEWDQREELRAGVEAECAMKKAGVAADFDPFSCNASVRN
jgi:hypothetical protein